MKSTLLFAALAAAFVFAGPARGAESKNAKRAEASGPAPNAQAINAAQFTGSESLRTGINPIVFKAQVLLDRAGFSPGSIDARDGENSGKALTAFQAWAGLPANGKLDRPTWEKLQATWNGPVVVDYTIRPEDVRGPFVEDIPSDLEKMGELKALAYRRPSELLSEKFHMDEDLLRTLNRGKNLDQAGTAILVANVAVNRRPAHVARIEIDKTKRELRGFAPDGSMVAYFPASIGSDEKPAPSGQLKVVSTARNPNYTYNPDYAFKGVKAKEKVTIAPGPNNPVGLVWIALSAESYGIHGTPEPDKVSKSYSHGCVRLTNWDALKLAGMVRKGTVVDFQDGQGGAPPEAPAAPGGSGNPPPT